MNSLSRQTAKIMSLTVLLWILSCSSFLPQAVAESKGSFGLMGGMIFSSRSSSTFTWGFQFAYKLKKQFGFGLFYSKYGIGVQASDTEDSGTTTIQTGVSNRSYGGEGLVFFSGGLNNFLAGVRLGILSIDATGDASAPDTDSINVANDVTAFFVGLKVGYDYRFSRFSVGADLSYNFAMSSDSPNVVYLFVPFKFWF